MSVIVEEVEAKLTEHLTSLKAERDQWNLAVLNGSFMEPAFQRMLNATESQMALGAIIKNAGMVAYLCRDADIILVFSGTLKANWSVLQEIVEELLPHLRPENIDFLSLFTFFELRNDFDTVMEWVEKKQQKYKQGTQRKEEVLPHEATWDEKKFDKALQARAARQKKLVAIVDDSQLHRQLARNVLKEEYDVVLAHNGFEAIELYNVCAPDLFFLDILMPYLDGVSALARITTVDPTARVVMFSTRSSENMLKKAMNLGAKGFVAKPFTAEALMHYARKTLNEK